jgi:23S rRNA (adenine2503-C2)-methyltransferase
MTILLMNKPDNLRLLFASDPAKTLEAGWGLCLPSARIESQETDEGVVKFRSLFEDGARVESVLLPIRNRVSLCVSSQVGCRMGCAFCATGAMGFGRDLTAAEMVWQVFAARYQLKSRVDNVVLMGMGEPLDNVENVMAAIRILGAQKGFNIPYRRITVSTAGHVDGLKVMAACRLPNLRLAVSLNAAEDGLRSRLMPINRRYPLAELKKALLAFPLPKQGAVFVEYVLLAGVNDSRDQARQVADYVKGVPVRINVIPYNGGRLPVFEAPSPERVREFCGWLAEEGLFARPRISRGRGVLAACGQLAG